MSRARALQPALTRILAAAALCAVSSCGDGTPTEPAGPMAGGSSLLGPAPSEPKLVKCGTNETQTESTVIGAQGGVVSIGGTKVVFPAGALPGLTTVTLTIPASPYVEIDIETDGAKYFPNAVNQPVVTIDYSHCTRSDVLYKPLKAWYIDAASKELLEEMIGVDNKLTKSVTFTTSHFSGYAIAF